MLRTRSPLNIRCIATPNVPFDLHVLTTPPAFILSQDQTLRKEFWILVILNYVTLTFVSVTIYLYWIVDWGSQSIAQSKFQRASFLGERVQLDQIVAFPSRAFPKHSSETFLTDFADWPGKELRLTASHFFKCLVQREEFLNNRICSLRSRDFRKTFRRFFALSGCSIFQWTPLQSPPFLPVPREGSADNGNWAPLLKKYFQ